MTALEAALTILWQGMLGIFAVMALITLIVMLFTKFSKYRHNRSKPSQSGGLDFFTAFPKDFLDKKFQRYIITRRYV